MNEDTDGYIEIEMPDGSIAEFPSSMTDGQIAAAIEKQFPRKKSESLKEKVLRYGIKNPVSGLAKFGNKIINLPPTLGHMAGLDFMPFYESEFNYDVAVGLPKEKNIGDIGVQLIPELLGAVAVPEANLGKVGAALSKIPKAGNYIQKILSQGIPQAGYAAAMANPNEKTQAALTAGATMAPFSVASEFAKSTSPAARLAAQGIGAIGGYELGKHSTEAIGASPQFGDLAGVIAGALGARGMTSPRMMQQRLTEGMNPEVVKERMAAANRLGLEYLSPAEASLNPFLGSRQGALGTTSEGSRMMYERAQKRLASEEKAINDLLESIYSESSMKPKMDILYKEAKSTVLPAEFSNKFKDNEIIKKAQKDIESSPAYREELKNLNKDSIGYWDLVKEAIYDLEEKAPKRERKIYSNARRSLVEDIDKYNPLYKEARSIAERKITREKLEKAFDKADPSGKSFFKALSSKEKFEKLQHNLRNVPEAQSRLKDMRMLFGDLINPPTVRGAAALEKTSMNKPRSSIQAASDAIQNSLTKGKYDKELIDFVTNPNWDMMMADLNKISNKQERMAKFLEYFGKAAAQSNAHKEPFMETENYEVY